MMISMIFDDDQQMLCVLPKDILSLIRILSSDPEGERKIKK